MGSDPVPEQYEQPKGFSVLLGIDDPVDAERIFHAFAENGTVQMPPPRTSPRIESFAWGRTYA
jgi:PhnB protein